MFECVLNAKGARAKTTKIVPFVDKRLKTGHVIAASFTFCLGFLTCELAFSQNSKVVALYPSFLLLLESSQLEFCTGSYVRLNMLCFFSFSDLVHTVHRKSGQILLRSGPNGLNESCSSLC